MTQQYTKSKTFRVIAALILPAVILLASGCIRAESAVTVREDGSGSFRVEMRFSQELVDALKPFGDSPEVIQATLLNNFRIGELGEGWSDAKVEAPPQGEGVGLFMSANFSDYTKIGPLLTKGNLRFYNELNIFRDGEKWVVNASPNDFSELDEQQFFGVKLSETIKGAPAPEIRFVFDLPGKPTEGNFSEQNGSQAIWVFNDGNYQDMNATWEDKSVFLRNVFIGFLMLWAAIIVIVSIRQIRKKIS